MRQHTKVPVSDVYAWSLDPSNPVGAEYIIMEKAVGVPVFKVWGDMAQPSKLELVKQLTLFERELLQSDSLPYGSLYLRSFSGNLPGYQLLDPDVDPSASYCIGRSGDRSYVPEDCAEVDFSKIDLGPC